MRKGILLLVMIVAVCGCKKEKRKQPIDYTPAKTVLIFPANDEACNTGIPSSITESRVTFRWNFATNAENYVLRIKNLKTQVYMDPITINDNQVEATLLKNTPYSWFIISESSKASTTTSSDIWKFYNSGPGEISHPPFPAELMSPALGAHVVTTSGKVTLTWTGGDVDNDMTGYDVYFGTTNPPLQTPTHVGKNSLYEMSVISNETYYWSVKTTDSKGNSSNSEIFQFDVNMLPIADFDINGTSATIYPSQQVTFRDKSLNNPTAWLWSFPGGNPSSSTSQNPTVTYANIGSYNVTLTVSNQKGSDSKTIPNYITVTTPWTCGEPFTDSRDGNTYSTVNINGQCWMAENLKYTDNGNIGVNYDNDVSFYNVFGRLYSFSEVINGNIAPAGWHIPSLQEVNSLVDYLNFQYGSNSGGAAKSSGNLWANPNVGATNASGFSALPAGMFFQNVFSDTGHFFFMWTSTPNGDGGTAINLRNNNSTIGSGGYIGTSYLSVRCVKD